MTTWTEVSPATAPTSIWDGGVSVWDNNQTFWDYGPDIWTEIPEAT